MDDGPVRTEDPIRPTVIRHQVEEIFHGAKLQERYNYIVYEFEQDGAFRWARTYLDEIRKVAIYGPFGGRDDHREVEAPDFRDAVLAYLKRRFFEIQELGDSGYMTIWRYKK